MPVKRKPPPRPPRRAGKNGLAQLYRSLAQGPTPAQRRKQLQERLNQRGIGPITDFENYLQEVGDFWPEDESCDEFLAWLRNLRREGRP
jgi:hypothetical protein